jgi:hypothetical protein
MLKYVMSQFTVNNVTQRQLIRRKTSFFFRVVVALLAHITLWIANNFKKQETEHHVTTYT